MLGIRPNETVQEKVHLLYRSLSEHKRLVFRDTRKSVQADANTNPATHEDPWALEKWRQKDCRANISADWYRPGRAEVLL